jgi:Domain of unknown function (DUF4426)
MKRRTCGWLPGCLLALFALSCGGGGTQQVAPAMPSDQTFKEQGDYEVHFNALRTDTLTQEVARAYGIQRSANRVMLNVTVLRQRKPVEAEVQADVYNLSGQLKNMEVRRISEGEAIYYIGEVSIGGAEILVFDITVTPAGTQAPLSVKFTREFVSS